MLKLIYDASRTQGYVVSVSLCKIAPQPNIPSLNHFKECQYKQKWVLSEKKLLELSKVESIVMKNWTYQSVSFKSKQKPIIDGLKLKQKKQTCSALEMDLC